MNKKIKRLKFDYKPKNVEEKEEMNNVQVNDLLKHRDAIIDAFEKRIFLFEKVKGESKNAGEFVLEEVSNFIQKIESISKNINLNFFNEFFESSLIDYAKYLINLKNAKKNKEFVTESKNRISSLKDRIKEMSEKEKKNKSGDETLKIIKEFIDYNRWVRRAFTLTSKIDKTKSEPKPEESIAERVKLRRQKSKEKEFNYFFTAD